MKGLTQQSKVHRVLVSRQA